MIPIQDQISWAWTESGLFAEIMGPYLQNMYSLYLWPMMFKIKGVIFNNEAVGDVTSRALEAEIIKKKAATLGFSLVSFLKLFGQTTWSKTLTSFSIENTKDLKTRNAGSEK